MFDSEQTAALAPVRTCALRWWRSTARTVRKKKYIHRVQRQRAGVLSAPNVTPNMHVDSDAAALLPGGHRRADGYSQQL